MPHWLQKAHEMFPELISRFEQVDTPYLLWFELYDEFIHSYSASPRNESLIMRVYQFADWCLEQPQGRKADDDLTTCVAVCFYEHLPDHFGIRSDMPRWFTVDDILLMKQIFCYHMSESEFEDLKRYFEQHQDMYVGRREAS